MAKIILVAGQPTSYLTQIIFSSCLQVTFTTGTQKGDVQDTIAYTLGIPVTLVLCPMAALYFYTAKIWARTVEACPGHFRGIGYIEN